MKIGLFVSGSGADFRGIEIALDNMAGGVEHRRAIRHTVDAGEPVGSTEVNPACIRQRLPDAAGAHNK